MTTLREAAQQALEALKSADWYVDQLEQIVYCPDDADAHEDRAKVQAAITALRAALEQPVPPPEAQSEAEKVAYCAGWWAALESVRKEQPEHKPMHPEMKKLWEDYFDKCFRRQPLTYAQIETLWDEHVVPVFGKNGISPMIFARAIERAHGIGGSE